MIRDYLRKTTRSPSEQVVRPQGGGSQPESGSVRDIANWLDNGTGDIVSIGKLSTYLKIWDTLTPEERNKVEKVPGNIAPENVITVKQATVLSDFEDLEEIIGKGFTPRKIFTEKAYNRRSHYGDTYSSTPLFYILTHDMGFFCL